MSRLENTKWAKVRISFRYSWLNDWQLLPYVREDRPGVELISFVRQQFPSEGTAVFKYDFGRFNSLDKPINASLETLIGAYIKIETSNRVDADGAEIYDIAWQGGCIAQRKQAWPGADYRVGIIEYHCVDLLAFVLKNRQLTFHGYYYGGTQIDRLSGFPGFNQNGRGDKSGVTIAASGDTPSYEAHTLPGNGDLWTAADIADYVLNTSKLPTEPDLPLQAYTATVGAGSPLDVAREVPYTDGQSCYEVLRDVLRPERGIYVFLDWATNGDPFISVKPYLSSDYSYPDGSSTVTVEGGTALGTTIAVNLQGEYRLGQDGPARFEESLIAWTRSLGVNVYGERLQVCGTLSGLDSTLAPRYTTAEAAALDGITDDEASEVRYGHVYRTYGLPTDWTTAALGDGASGGSNTRIDYRFSGELGTIELGTGDATIGPSTINILPDCPMYDGINYTVNPPAQYEAGDPERPAERVQIMAFRINGGTYKSLFDNADSKVVISRDGPDIRITSSSDSGSSRMLSTDEENGIALTVGLELPIRPVVSASRPSGLAGPPQIREIFVPDAHLWLVHTGAIIGLDSSGNPIRPSATTGVSNAAIARDDRDTLRRILAQARLYYLRDRRRGSWSLRCCGIGTDADVDTTPAWPKLGNIVSTMTYAGVTRTWDTPVSRVEYDHVQGITTWTTDFADRDWI